MPYSETLAERVNTAFNNQAVTYQTKKMMGGLCYLVDDKMCVGVSNDDLMVRLDPELYTEVLTRKGCRPMDFTGRPLKGFVFVSPEGTRTAPQLNFWLGKALEFNPKAKSSKTKKKRKTSPIRKNS